jgi:hypothetical protein
MRSVLALLAIVASATSAIAMPVNEMDAMKRSIIKRQSVTSGADDATVLQFALTLVRPRLPRSPLFSTPLSLPPVLKLTSFCFIDLQEHLENSFYSQALAKFNEASFTSAGYPGLYQVLQQVGRDEAAHVEFLTTALSAAGATPVQGPPFSCYLYSWASRLTSFFFSFFQLATTPSPTTPSPTSSVFPRSSRTLVSRLTLGSFPLSSFIPYFFFPFLRIVLTVTP